MMLWVVVCVCQVLARDFVYEGNMCVLAQMHTSYIFKYNFSLFPFSITTKMFQTNADCNA